LDNKKIILSQEIEDLLDELDTKSLKGIKQARVMLETINHYFKVLNLMGTRAGENFTKHLEDEIWELRPKNYRLLFAIECDYIFLTSFIKKTKKTPRREIDKAKKAYNLYKETKKI
jgi:phage-related protein